MLRIVAMLSQLFPSHCPLLSIANCPFRLWTRRVPKASPTRAHRKYFNTAPESCAGPASWPHLLGSRLKLDSCENMPATRAAVAASLMPADRDLTPASELGMLLAANPSDE